MSVRLPEHLDLIAAAPGGIQKLRGLILELAVRGKLVPQEPKDEPASELLKRIAKERARLEAEGTCKKSKATPLVGEDEQSFDVPIGWSWTRLGDVVMDSSAGWSPSCESRPRTKSEWGVLKVSAVSWGVFDPDENKALPANLEPRPEHEVTQGDFLVSRANTAELVARSVFVEEAAPRLMLSDKIVRLRLSKNVAGRYINVVNTCSAARTYYAHIAGGTSSSMKNVTREQILNLAVPLAPLAEQHRIVAKVDELMALCDRLEAEQTDAEAAHAKLVETLLGTLTQSTDAADLAAHWPRLAEHFDTLFTTESSLDTLKQTVLELAVMGKLVPQDANDEPASELLKRIAKERARLEAEGTCKKSKATPLVGKDEQTFVLPAGWEWVRFAAIAVTRLGKMLDAAKNRGVPKPYLRNTNVQWFRFELDDVKELRLSPEELGEFRLENGDLLICEGGEPGRCAIWRSETAEMYFQKALHRARPNGGVLAEYLQLVLRQDAVSGALGAYFTGATIKHFPGDKLAAYAIPLPPVNEQHRIVAKVDELMALCDRLRAGIKESRTRQDRLSATLIESALAA